MKPGDDGLTYFERREVRSWPFWRRIRARRVNFLRHGSVLLRNSYSVDDLYLEERYGDEVAAWLRTKFKKLEVEVNDGCTSDYRVGIVGKEDDHYMMARDDGCCGFASYTVKWRDGVKYRIGFTYGH